MGLVDDDNTIDGSTEEIGLEWQLGRAGGHPLTHKHQLKADGSAETLPLPPIVLAALKIARKMQAERRTEKWPEICICGERHRLLFTTDTGRPIEPRNSSAVLTRAAKRRESVRSRFTTRDVHAGHCWPRSTFTRASPWRSSGIAG
jgi:hypothetical protein